MSLTNLITIFFATSLWIWISRQIFDKSDKKIFVYTSIYSIAGVILILILKLASQYWLLTISQSTILTVIIISSILVYPMQKNRNAAQYLQTILLITPTFIYPGIITQYMIASRAEESLKRSNIKNCTSGPLGQVILGCIMSGIVFGISETIAYGISTSILHDITSVVQIVTQRSFIPIVLHSGTIVIGCLISYALLQKIHPIIAWIVGLSTGIVIHLAFNLSNIYGYIPVIIIIIIGCIGSLSYGFFRSDTLYISEERRDKL